MVENQTKQEIPGTESKILEVWKEFSGNSTLHGLKNAVLSRSVYLRVAWSLAVLAAFSYLMYSTLQSWDRYRKYETRFQVSQGMKPSLVFPAITICSRSTADKKRIFTRDDEEDFIIYGLNISACAATADVRAQMNISCGYAFLCACAVKLPDIPFIEGCNKSVQEKVTNALISHQIDFNSEEFFLRFSQTWNEIIHWCYYGLHYTNCTPHFKPVITSHGVCYSFNSNMKNPSKSSYPGAEGGLRIALKIQHDRLFFPWYSEGFKVFVNEQKDVLPVTGINAGSGLLTSISLKMQKVKFKKPPYGAQCGWRQLKGLPFYSRAACFGECWSDFFYEACGCRPAGYAKYNDSITCYSIHSSCIRNAMASFKFSCDCPIACEVTKYITEVSYGTLPHRSIDGVRQRFKDVNYSRESYVLIEVGFSDLSYNLEEEKLAFDETSLLGEVGGNMGLLLGCSVLTVMELIEFLFAIILLRLKRNNVGVQ